MSRSGGSSMALSKASAPSVAVSTGVVSSARSRRNISKIIGLSSTSRVFTLAAMTLLLYPSIQFMPVLVLAAVLATLAPRLALQDDLADFDTFIQGLAHVIDGKSGNTRCYQRFHLDASGGRRCGGGDD